MKEKVSVVIPMRNEERFISECLDSIIEQTWPKDSLEVFLVDGMSEDRTREIVDGYSGKHPWIRLLDNPEKLVPSALNIGVAESSGDVVIRMDAHTYYAKDYIEKCVETLGSVDAVNVGGPIVTLPGDDTPRARAIAVATSHPFGVGNSAFRTTSEPGYVDTVPFGAFRREVFSTVGGFNERLARNQDIEFNSRIRASGGKIYINPEIRSYYYNRATLGGLWSQNFKNGMWNIFTSALTRRSLSARHFIPLVFVVALVLSFLLAFVHPAAGALFAVVAGSYALANLFFSVRLSMSRKNGLKMLPHLPLVFLTLHLSYGLGSLYGLATVGRWKRAAGAAA